MKKIAFSMLSLVLASCVVSPQGADPNAAEVEAGLTDSKVHFPYCTLKQQARIKRALHVGRAAMTGSAFQSCLIDAIGQVTGCQKDSDCSFIGLGAGGKCVQMSGSDGKVDPAAATCHKPTTVHFSSGFSWDLGPYEYQDWPRDAVDPPRSDPEDRYDRYRWLHALSNATSLDNPLEITCNNQCSSIDCAGASSPNLRAVAPGETMKLTLGSVPDSDWNDSNDSTDELAGLIWHEIMHNRGYQHGGTAQLEERHNVPYMLTWCMMGVVNSSTAYCDRERHDITKVCGSPSQVSIVSAFNEPSCACRTDPGYVAEPRFKPLHPGVGL
jgi:hypothetical protein